MIYKEFIKKLCDFLNLKIPSEAKDKSYLIELNDEISFKILPLEEKIYLSAFIDSMPNEKKEELFIYLMKANLLGQGTAESRIGLDSDEKMFTLSCEISTLDDFNEFKDKVEDFANYLKYWKDEIAKFKRLIEQGILK